MPPVLAVADEKGFDGRNVGVRDRAHPIAEIEDAKSGRRHAFAAETRGVALFHGVTLVDDDNQETILESL
jgi:hypothetical protein